MKKRDNVRLSITYVPIGEILTDPQNPRFHNKRHIKALARSIKEFEFSVPVLLDENRRLIAGHPFGTLKAWMGSTHFQMKTLKHVRTEASLHILAYNFKRLVAILGVRPMIAAIQT